MNWIECIVHTTTAGSDWVSDCLMELGATGTMIEDRADIPDPSKPHGIWEIIDPKLLESMPEDVLVHAWFTPDDSFPETFRLLNSRLAEMHTSQPSFGSLQADTHTVSEDAWAEVWKKYYKPFYAGKHLVVKPTWEPFDPAPDDKIIEIDPGMAFCGCNSDRNREPDEHSPDPDNSPVETPGNHFDSLRNRFSGGLHVRYGAAGWYQR